MLESPALQLERHSTAKRRPMPAALLRRPEAANFCGVGLSTWDKLTASGLTPAPIKLAGSVCWNRRELSAWVDHGCPPRSEWSTVWADILRRRLAKK